MIAFYTSCRQLTRRQMSAFSKIRTSLSIEIQFNIVYIVMFSVGQIQSLTIEYKSQRAAIYRSLSLSILIYECL